jgi:hypothetical protein
LRVAENPSGPGYPDEPQSPRYAANFLPGKVWMQQVWMHRAQQPAARAGLEFQFETSNGLSK